MRIWQPHFHSHHKVKMPQVISSLYVQVLASEKYKEQFTHTHIKPNQYTLDFVVKRGQSQPI